MRMSDWRAGVCSSERSLRAGLISRLSYWSSRECLLPAAGISAGSGSFQGMSVVSEADVLEALKAVKEPSRDSDIVSLGMVSGLIIKDGNVGFAIEVDPRQGAAMEPDRKSTRLNSSH